MAKWMKEAFGAHPGRLHRALGVPEGEPIPASKLARAAHSRDPHMRRMAAAAHTGAKIARRRHVVPRAKKR